MNGANTNITAPETTHRTYLFPTKVPSSGRCQLSDFAVLDYGLRLGFWVVFVITVSST